MAFIDIKQTQSPVSLPQDGVGVFPAKLEPNLELATPSIDNSKEAYHVVRKVETTFEKLSQLAEHTKCDINDLITVWTKIPVKNNDGADSLIESGEAIIAISEAIDKKYPNLVANEKTALKLRVMAIILNLKADLLHSENSN
jgi:hypothetical protein